MPTLTDLDAKVDALTDIWLDAICKGSASDAQDAAELVHRAEDQRRAMLRETQAKAGSR